MSILSEALASQGGKSLKPEHVGETITGTITNVDVVQARDYTSGDPKFWDDGKPQQQIVITLDTGNPALGDEGKGAVYIKNWGAQRKALLEAVNATGLDADTALAPGNQFSVTLAGEEPNVKNPRMSATKIYRYEISPRSNVGGALQAEPQASAPAPVAPQQQPVQQAYQQAAAPAQAPVAAPQTPPATGGVDITQLINSGLTDDVIANLTGMAPSAVAAIRTTLAA